MSKKAKLSIFIAFMALFTALEVRLYFNYVFPDHAIPYRHKIVPSSAVENKLFADFEGTAHIKIPVKWIDLEKDSRIKGVQIKTGTYSQSIRGATARIQVGGVDICKSLKTFSILENQWTSINLECEPLSAAHEEDVFLIIDGPAKTHWALYQFSDNTPAARLWLEESKPLASYFQARNYGNLWASGTLHLLRLLTRVICALGFVFLFAWRKQKSRVFNAAMLIWLGLFSGEFFETVTYQNADETQHAVGAARSVTPKENWNEVYHRLKMIGSRLQFKETFAKSNTPILAEKRGEPWVSSDDFFMNPEERSLFYSLVAHPIASASLFLSDKLGFICDDSVTYMRGFLATLIAILMMSATHIYRRTKNDFAAWVLLISSTIPATMSSLLTVWNYGLLTVLGTIFCTNLVVRGSPRNQFKFFACSALLIPFLADFARSQILWFIAGPTVISAAWIYMTSRRISSNPIRLKGMIFFPVLSLAAYGLLILIFQEQYIPDRRVIVAFIKPLSERNYLPSDFADRLNLLTFAGFQILNWTVSLAIFSALDLGLKRINLKLDSSIKARLQNVWLLVIFFGVASVLYKCWSIKDVSYLQSLVTLTRYPDFYSHFKEGYRALMSQTFARNQDYFLVQTFFMAYGWLETTGHWLIYVIYRHLVEIGLVAVLVASRRNFVKFVEFDLPLFFGFLGYFLGIWRGAWIADFTVVGRFVFPGICLFFIPILSASCLKTPTVDKVHARQPLLIIIFIYLAANCIYGSFYLLPLRFTVGL